MTLQKQIGSRLRAIREALEYKRPEVEQHTGIKKRKIMSLELNEIRPHTDAVNKLCEFYDVAPEALMYSDEKFENLISELSGSEWSDEELLLRLSKFKEYYIW